MSSRLSKYFTHKARGITILSTYVARLLCSLCVLVSSVTYAQQLRFQQANCTIIYSLKRSADTYFNQEIQQLAAQIDKHDVRFIDLNHWRKDSPHIEVSGRVRNQIRQQFGLVSQANQAILLNNSGEVIQRYTGSVTLVNALLDCH